MTVTTVAWVRCPACDLGHSARPDGRCPRCGASVSSGGDASRSPCTLPEPERAPEIEHPAGAARPRGLVTGRARRAAIGTGALVAVTVAVAVLRRPAPTPAERLAEYRKQAEELTGFPTRPQPPPVVATSGRKLVGSDGSYELELPPGAWREAPGADEGWLGRPADRIAVREDLRGTLAVAHDALAAPEPVPTPERELGWVRGALFARRVTSFSGASSRERPSGVHVPAGVQTGSGAYRWEENGEFFDADAVVFVAGRDVFTVLVIRPDRVSAATAAAEAEALELRRAIWSLRPFPPKH